MELQCKQDDGFLIQTSFFMINSHIHDYIRKKNEKNVVLPPGVDPTAGVLFPRSPDAWAFRDISNATCSVLPSSPKRISISVG